MFSYEVPQLLFDGAGPSFAAALGTAFNDEGTAVSASSSQQGGNRFHLDNVVEPLEGPESFPRDSPGRVPFSYRADIPTLPRL